MYLVREGQAREIYPVEVDRWYAFLFEVRDAVGEMIGHADKLAEKHKLSPLRPLTAMPLVLQLREEELAAEQEVRGRAYPSVPVFLREIDVHIYFSTRSKVGPSTSSLYSRTSAYLMYSNMLFSNGQR